MFNGLGYCPLTGLQSRAPTGLITGHNFLNNGAEPVPYAGSGEQRRKYQLIFCVGVNLWLHSDIYFYFFFLAPEIVRSLNMGQSGSLVTEQGSHGLRVRLRGNKGLSKRPTCIGTEGVRTHFLLYSILFYSSVCRLWR
jgi:hypothetical protein